MYVLYYIIIINNNIVNNKIFKIKFLQKCYKKY